MVARVELLAVEVFRGRLGGGTVAEAGAGATFPDRVRFSSVGTGKSRLMSLSFGSGDPSTSTQPFQPGRIFVFRPCGTAVVCCLCLCIGCSISDALRFFPVLFSDGTVVPDLAAFAAVGLAAAVTDTRTVNGYVDFPFFSPDSSRSSCSK